MDTLASSKVQSWLSWFLRGLLIFGFLILVARLIELQLIKTDYYQILANGNRVRRVPIIAARGDILARGGEVIADSKNIRSWVTFSAEEGYVKTRNLDGAPEEEIITEAERRYINSTAFAHLTGYLNEVDEAELGKIDPQCLGRGPKSLGSLVGRTGLEEYYQCSLSGYDGEELIEVDAQGKRIRSLGRRNPVQGENLETSIDLGLQNKVAQVMEGINGAVVASDEYGEILALFSSPSFDANLLLNPNQNEKVLKRLFSDSDLPFFNRVIAGSFPPGSVYKPLIALAALEEEAIDSNYTFEDTGQIILKTLYGTFTYSNWYFTQYGGVEGKVDLVRAIARSTDTFFYRVGELLGIDNIVSWSKLFGLGEITGIDLPGEIKGLMPSPEWKEEVKNEKWFLGNTYHLAIGQGDLSLTPIQINSLTSTIASKGKLCQPTIAGNESCDKLKIDKESIKEVTLGMIAVCEEDGTGFTFFDFPEEVACKTGTAETFDKEEPHAWFTMFAPVEFPEIVLTVLVENGGEGSKVAGPIAREIMDYWFGFETVQDD